MTAAFRNLVRIDQALRDPNLLGAALGDASTWQTWIAVLKAAYGIALSDDEQEAFSTVAGPRTPPGKPVRELWAVAGRRSGKSRMAAAVATFAALFSNVTGRLAAGENGIVLVLASSRGQAKVVFNYINGYLSASPVLRNMIVTETAEEIRLSNGVTIQVQAASFRSVRGHSLLCVVADEISFWRSDESAQPDREIVRALLPGLATTAGMLVAISSPWGRRGLLFERHFNCFGKDDASVLVVQGSSRTFNATLDQGIVDLALQEDEQAATSEWLGEFRSDLSSFVQVEVVRRCVEPTVRERVFDKRYVYNGFCDTSGGQHDSMVLSIAHAEGVRRVLDLTREVRAPFSPSDIVAEFVATLRRYRITSVRGDRYGSGWVSEAFSTAGIRYVASEQSRSQLYLELLPLLMSERAVLLDDTRLVTQLARLERRAERGGRESIDHPRGAADDLANGVAGALVNAREAAPRWVPPPNYRPKFSDPLADFR